jgi:hypothetical protein
MGREAYPSDVSDEEWALVALSLILRTPDAPQQEHSLARSSRGGAGSSRRCVADAAPCLHSSALDACQTRSSTGTDTGPRVVVFYAWGLFVVRDTEGLRGFLACSWLSLL